MTNGETYLRRLAETELRGARAGETAAADAAARIDAVAAAFEATGVLDGTTAGAVVEDFQAALAARSLAGGMPHPAGHRRPPVSTLRGFAGAPHVFAYGAVTRMRRARSVSLAASVGPFGPTSVIPAGTVLRLRDGADEDVYLLAFVQAPGRAWLSVAARTGLAPARFTGSAITAVDDAGRQYALNFTGGGGTWYLGRLTLSPAPPPGLAWLEVSCAGESARIDLAACPPDATVSVRPMPVTRGEAYLRQRAEILLEHRALAPAEAAGMASVVPALRAVGALPADSAILGEVAALLEQLGVPGGAIASPLAELPARWASALAAGWDGRSAEDVARDDPVAGAHATVALPEADGVAVTLAGLLTWPGGGTVIFGGLHPRPDAVSPAFTAPSLWLKDDAGHWHSVSITGWSSDGSNSGSYPFQAVVVPPLPPTVATAEFFVTGPATEVRAVVPLTWWRS